VNTVRNRLAWTAAGLLLCVGAAAAVVRLLHQSEWPVLVSFSPHGQYEAVLYKTSGFGPTVGADFIVRVRRRGADKLDEVWRASGVPPARLDWQSDDSLFVIVPEMPRSRDLRWPTHAETAERPSVSTRRTLFSAATLESLPAFRP